uniref:Uncharacterized protein n=1 Tax=viral metagenome TaxID=1070528 RepID=A0A6M3L5N4_9ZZZZ
MPKEWPIFNAPRPIYGVETWEGDFHHGRFYAAVDLDDSLAAMVINENIVNDAWVCEYITKAHAIEWAKEYYSKMSKINLDDFEPQDLVEVYLHHQDRIDVDAKEYFAKKGIKL